MKATKTSFNTSQTNEDDSDNIVKEMMMDAKNKDTESISKNMDKIVTV